MESDTTIESDSTRDGAAADGGASEQAFRGPDRRSHTAFAGPDRRRFTWRTIVYGIIKPRRRNVRRASDAPNAYVDFHSNHLLLVAAAILIFSVIDGMLAIHFASAGAFELNPAMAALVERDAVQFAIVKWLLTATAVVALIIAERAHIFGRIRAVYFLYAIMIGYGMLVAYSLSLALTRS
jgi:hypothetical protein